MKKVDEILDKIVMPAISFKLKAVDDVCIMFEEGKTDIEVPGDDEISKLVKQHIGRAIFIDKSYGQYNYEINRSQIYDAVREYVRRFHIDLWLLVNNKTEFNRTKLKKDMAYARSDKFKDICLELFLDAAKYGITKSTLVKGMQIKPIHKFIALKFQAMVEAECPR